MNRRLQLLLYALPALAVGLFYGVQALAGPITPQYGGGTATSTQFTTGALIYQNANSFGGEIPIAGSNMTITTSTPGQITFSSSGGSASAVGPANSLQYNNAGSLGGTSFFQGGTGGIQLGINSTTPIGNLVVQGTSTQPTLPVLTVSSSTNATLFQVAGNGSTTISSLTAGCVNSTATGALFSAPCPPTTVVYISKIPGIHQNTNLVNGGGTDDTALIQAVIDHASTTNTSLMLVQDGASLITGLTIPGNFTLKTLAGDGFFMQATSTASMFINKNILFTPGSSVDQNITIEGGTFNANGLHQVQATGSGSGIVPMKNVFTFFGVNNVTVKDVTMNFPANFGIWGANDNYVTINNIIYNAAVFPSPFYTSAIQFEGNAYHIFISNLQAFNNMDDTLGFNADDGNWPAYTGQPSSQVPPVAGGPIEDVTVDGAKFVNDWDGVRLLSNGNINGTGVGNRIDQVFINNVTGTTTGAFFYIDGYGGSGKSNIGSFTVNNANVNCHTGASNYNGLGTFLDGCIVLNDNMQNANLTNISRVNSQNTIPLIRVGSGGNIDHLNINNIHINQGSVSAMTELQNFGSISQLDVSNVNEYQTGSPVLGAFFQNEPGATVTQSNYSNLMLHNIGGGVYNLQGIMNTIAMSNVNIYPTSTLAALEFDGSTTTPDVMLSNINTIPAFTTTNGATLPKTLFGDGIITGGTFGQFLETTGTSTMWGTPAGGGGSGNSAWTIGSALIYNATSTDSVFIGTSTAPTTSTLFVQGSGSKVIATFASSTGATVATIQGAATANQFELGTSTDTSDIAILQGNSTYPTAPLLKVASSTGLSILLVGPAGNVSINTSTLLGDLNIQDQSTSATTTETLGSGTSPSCLKLFSPNGTKYYLTISNAGGFATSTTTCLAGY